MKRKVSKKSVRKVVAKPAPAVKDLKKLLSSRRREIKGLDKQLAKAEASAKLSLAELKAIGKGVKIIADKKLSGAFDRAGAALKVQVAGHAAALKDYKAVDVAYEKAIAAIDRYMVCPVESLENKIGEFADKCLTGIDGFIDKLTFNGKAVAAADKAMSALSSVIEKMVAAEKRKTAKKPAKRSR